ncbi:MAG: Polyketide cyclase/dehydrase [Myxococcaceae bacterium]|nr:Polyketide cyclase/dehydrase [Myxococcaceae bacterium]
MSQTSPEKATKSASAFRMTCAVSIDIQAAPERIWEILTDAADFPRWNSTVTRIKGTIAAGEKLALEVPAAPGRTFTPKVTELDAARRMVWADGMAPMFKGVRTFTLAPKGDGSTTFTMEEVFSGIMLPMIKGSLPDFAPSFEVYAEDLKREAEARR